MVGLVWPGALRAAAQPWANALPLCEALSPWERLDPQRKLLVMLALVVILFMGMMLMVLIFAGGRWLRRIARPREPQRGSSMIGPSDWEPQPYVAERDAPPRRRDSDPDDFDAPDDDGDE